MRIGDKVKWQHGAKTRSGVIHGIQKAENENGTEVVIGYAVDTGKELYREDRFSEKTGKKLKDPFIQPETIILAPEQVTAA